MHRRLQGRSHVHFHLNAITSYLQAKRHHGCCDFVGTDQRGWDLLDIMDVNHRGWDLFDIMDVVTLRH